MKKTVLLGFALAFCVLGSSCSDDEVIPPVNPGNPDAPLIDDGAIDVLNGYNSIILPIENITDIELFTKRPVRLNYEDNKFVQFVVEKVGDKQFLRTKLKQAIEAKDLPLSFKIDIVIEDPKNQTKADGEADLSKKTLYLSYRSFQTEGIPNTQDVYFTRSSIGKGVNLLADMGNVTYSALDYTTIYPELSKEINVINRSIFYEFCGEDYHSALDKLGVNLGIHGAVPVKGVVLSGGADYSYSESGSNVNDFEFYISYYGKSLREAKLNMDAYKSCGYHAILDTTFNNVMNNPGTEAYKEYPNTLEGITALLDYYGTHIITKGTFGGNYTVLFGRETNAYGECIGNQAGASLNLKVPVTEGKSWLDMYKNKTASPNVGGSVGFGNGSEKLDQATRAFHVVTAKGGSASQDMDDWDASLNRKDVDGFIPWVITSYATLDNPDNGLIELKDARIVLDSARRAALETHWDTYFKNAKKEEKKENPMVVVDLMMLKGTESHKVNEPKPFVAQDPSGQYRCYFPMVANGNAPTYVEYPFETSGREYVATEDYCDQYWYYALAHYDKDASDREKINPVIEVLFTNKDKVKDDGFVQRGDHANDDISGLFDNCYVYLKFANADTDPSQFVRAIGFKEEDSGKIITSTGGSEMRKPFSGNDSSFDEYWKDAKQSSNESAKTWYSGGAVLKRHQFVPVYSTKDLDVEFRFGDQQESKKLPKIYRPKPWPYDGYRE